MLILAAMLMPVMLFGQQKLIDDAMRYRNRGVFCQVQNTSVILLHEELQLYCQQNGYYLRGEKTRKVSRHPIMEEYDMVTYFEVLPMAEVDEYIYTDKCEISSKPSFDALSAIGNGWFFSKKEGEYLNDIKWSGTVQNGLINGKGIGYCKKGKICYLVSGEFVAGFPKGEVVFENYSYSDNVDKGLFWSTRITFGEMSDGMAWVKRAYDTKFGFVTAGGKYVAIDKYDKILQPFRNSQASVVSDGKEIIISKNCNFIDYTDRQKEKDEQARLAAEEAERARQQRIQDSLDRVRQRIQDSLDYIEQLRIAEEKRQAEYNRLVDVNCNPKLWSMGDHICYQLTEGDYAGKLTCGTLEEWNENHSKAKIKIVTSPSKDATYQGELLQKNNTFWINTQGDKWHLALKGEFEETLKYDNSIKGPDVIYVNNQSSSSSSGPKRYDDCSYCKGAGKLPCSSCNGDGWDSWDDKTCSSCHGAGMIKCYHCRGTGKQ